ncbi:MAG: GGDEF domain-containing protein [Thermoanaerobaculia bacterium]|nr:MAG: GGDEF domain-containing protein [Thermoanaerobaculia bacterium]
MRAVAIAAGLGGYVAFAALVLWLHAPGPGDGMLALHACPGMPGEVPAVPFYEILERPSTVRLCGEAPAGYDLLVLPRISGNAITVRVDGALRHRVGALDRPANLWLQPQRIPLDDERGRSREIEIELGGLYDLGVRVAPVLTSFRAGGRRADLLAWVNGDLVALATGFNLGVGLLLFAYGVRRRRDRSEYLVLGVSAMCAALYMLDFHPGGGAVDPATYLLRRKISLAGAYFTVACLVSGLERVAAARRRLGTTALAGAGVLSLLMLIQPDPVALKTASDWGSMLAIPMMIYAVGVVVRRLEPAYVALWAFFGASALHVLVNSGFLRGHLFLLQFGILAGTVAAGLRSAVQLTRVAVDLERAARAAMTDPLTGARNRAFCEQLELDATDVVALFDFDDFKRVNDELGHSRGDRLLVDFVLAARARLRANDHVVRLGGDEFVLVLRRVELRTAHHICQEILDAWRRTSPDLAASASFGLAQAGTGAFESALAEADARMYASKAAAGRR